MPPTHIQLDQINSFVTSISMKLTSISHGENPWYYWLRGKMNLSNIADFFILTGCNAVDVRREIHVAFDPIGRSKDLRVLIDRVLD